MMLRIAAKTRDFLSSKLFWRLTLGFFIFQAAWIAFSAAYPQAFDEEFHFGLIQTYSHYWLPFLTAHPSNADAYGAVAHDPSYLYHYLLSFPYRVFGLITDSQMAQVIFLRLLNVGLFAAGLILFRRVILRSGISRGAANVCIALVSLIPIIPQLAGQINYDNLLVPMTAVAYLLTATFIDEIRRRRPSFSTLVGLLVICLFSTLVMYQFAPIFLAIGLFTLTYACLRWRGKWRSIASKSWREWQKRPWTKYVLVMALVVAFGMFAQRDVVNIVKYHEIAPDCAKILSVEQCDQYPVWNHDNWTHQQVVDGTVRLTTNPIEYVGEWTYWLWFRLFFSIAGVEQNYQNFPPLPLPAAAFALIAISSLIVIIIYWRRIFVDQPWMIFLGVSVLLYLAILMNQGWAKYQETNVLQLMNGRYLLPVLIPGMILALRGWSEALRNRPSSKPVLAVVVLVCFLQGGGLFTFVSRSNDSWYWNSPLVRTSNHILKDISEPIIIDGPSHYEGKWFFN